MRCLRYWTRYSAGAGFRLVKYWHPIDGAMISNYADHYRHLENRVAQLGREISGPMSGFARLHRKSLEERALSSKVKELMALAVSIASHCEGCIVYHVHDAIAAGATRQELLETIGVAVMRRRSGSDVCRAGAR